MGRGCEVWEGLRKSVKNENEVLFQEKERTIFSFSLEEIKLAFASSKLFIKKRKRVIFFSPCRKEFTFFSFWKEKTFYSVFVGHPAE